MIYGCVYPSDMDAYMAADVAIDMAADVAFCIFIFLIR